MYYTDRSKIFSTIYIPTEIEILKLESQTDPDVLHHLAKYNPYNLIEEVGNKAFFSSTKSFSVAQQE